MSLVPRNSKKWIPHPLDSLDAKVLRQKCIDKNIFPLEGKTPDVKKRRNRLGKLSRIIREEHEACGEENW